MLTYKIRPAHTRATRSSKTTCISGFGNELRNLKKRFEQFKVPNCRLAVSLTRLCVQKFVKLCSVLWLLMRLMFSYLRERAQVTILVWRVL